VQGTRATQAAALPGGAVNAHIDRQFWSDQPRAEPTLIIKAMIRTREYFHIGVPPCGSVSILPRPS
jgi:hypothetical protein